MGPVNQSPLLGGGKINLIGTHGSMKPSLMSKPGTNITPTLYQHSDGIHAVEINQRLDSPYTHNF